MEGGEAHMSWVWRKKNIKLILKGSTYKNGKAYPIFKNKPHANYQELTKQICSKNIKYKENSAGIA